MMKDIVSCAISDVGLKRSNNEDAFLADKTKGFWSLADGIGGAAAGELASQFFTGSADEVFSEKRSEMEPVDLVRAVFELAHKKILEHVMENPEHQGMGCTAELITFNGEDYVLGHVGDSRAYLFRNGQLRQITHDHSLVQEELDKGLINQDEARKVSFRNVILRAVGIGESLAVDLLRGKIMDGDIFLLCSDGLTDMIDDDAIRETMSMQADLYSRCERLIELANSAGGKDNITVVLCQVVQMLQ